MPLYYIREFREKRPEVTQGDLMPLNDLSSVTEKVEKLTEILEMPETEYDEKKSACAELHEILKVYYPESSLLMFGSAVNGFGMKKCAVDLLFLPFPDFNVKLELPTKKNEPPFKKNDSSYESTTPVPAPASILSGETSRDVLSTFDEWGHIKFIRNALRADKTVPKKVHIAPIKLPVLRVNFPSKVTCDVHVRNRIVVSSSELLLFFSKLDPRVKPLILTLRYWARTLGFIKRSADSFIKRSFFTNYSFELLVVSFLQNVSPPVLPSVKHLIEISGVNEMTDGWQIGFTRDEKLIKKSKNTETVGDLFVHFFEYYWNFDFVQNVVSPYFGRPLPIKELRNSRDERVAKFEVSAISIQDPFILCSNLCNVEGPESVFRLCLLTASQILKGSGKFNDVFYASIYQNALNTNYEKYMLGGVKACFINFDFDCASKLSKISKNPQLWYQKATQAVFDVLQYGLLMECEVTDKISWDQKLTAGYKNGDVRQKHVAPKSDLNAEPASEATPYDLELLVSIQCVLYSRTYIGRKNVIEITFNKDDLDEFSDSALKAEYGISRELVMRNPALDSRVPLLCFKCDCYKHTSPQIPNVVVILKPLTFSREFYQISSFLGSYIPKTVRKILCSD